MDETEHRSLDSSLKRVLCVGNAVVDCINIVDKFPTEDSEQFGREYYWQRGGNATNNCTVLSLLNTPCEFVGVLPISGEEARWIREDFHQAGIPIDRCVTTPGQCPIATSIISTHAGSRTILAFPRECPELTHAQFQDKLKGDFKAYSWVHFELRHQTEEVVGMMKDVATFNQGQQEAGNNNTSAIVSVEVESPNTPDPERAMTEADFVFVSKDFAQSRSCHDIGQALDRLYGLCKPGSCLVCPWGDRGAGARYKDNVVMSPARADVKVVDSLGAGDTFNAGFISSLLKYAERFGGLQHCLASSRLSEVLNVSLTFACQVAGYKCSIYGYRGLKDLGWSPSSHDLACD